MNLESFFIVVPQSSLAWSYSNTLTDYDVCSFSLKDNHLVGANGDALFINNDGVISFRPDGVRAAEVVLEPTSITTNYKIRCGERYIIHKDGKLECSDEGNGGCYWVFMTTEIDTNHTFVIARYSENPNWVRFLPGQVILYNKGKRDIDFEHRGNIQKKHLPNVGREGHTYLTHMIENYEFLTERVSFLQADPFTHSDNILEICSMSKDFADFQSLSMYYLTTLPHYNIIQTHVKRLNGAGWTLFPIDKNGQHFEFYDINWRMWSDAYIKNKSPMTEFLERVNMSHKSKNIYLLCLAALYSVNKKNILLNTKDDYVRIRTELIKYKPQAGFEGYLLERLWHTLLTEDTEPRPTTISEIFGKKPLFYFSNKSYLPFNTDALQGYNCISVPRFIMPEKEFIFKIKSYSSIINLALSKYGSEFITIANLGCQMIEGGAGSEQRLNKYLQYLINHLGEWDLFLGAPDNVRPMRVVCQDPCIIECSYATDLTFAIHSLNSARIIQEYAADSTKYTDNLDVVLVNKLIEDGRKIWIPYPVLCTNVKNINYTSNINNTLKTFLNSVVRR
jgi:hypothetical protein